MLMACKSVEFGSNSYYPPEIKAVLDLVWHQLEHALGNQIRGSVQNSVKQLFSKLIRSEDQKDGKDLNKKTGNCQRNDMW